MHPNLIFPFGEAQCHCILSVEAKMMPRYFDAWMSDYSSMEHPLASLKARRFPDAFQQQALVHTYTQHVRPRVVCACLFIRPFYGPPSGFGCRAFTQQCGPLKPQPTIVQPCLQLQSRDFLIWFNQHTVAQLDLIPTSKRQEFFSSLFNLKSYLLYPADNSSLQKSKFAIVVCCPQEL